MVKKKESLVNENYYFSLLNRTNLTFFTSFIKVSSLANGKQLSWKQTHPVHVRTWNKIVERNKDPINRIEEGERRNLLLVNDGPNVSSLEGPGNIPFLQTIDDLNLTNHLAVLQNLEARTFDD